MSTTPSGQDERAAFEAWASEQPRHQGVSLRFLALNNAYIDFDLHGAWLAWQARASLGIPSEAQRAAQDDAYVCGRNDERATQAAAAPRSLWFLDDDWDSEDPRSALAEKAWDAASDAFDSIKIRGFSEWQGRIRLAVQALLSSPLATTAPAPAHEHPAVAALRLALDFMTHPRLIAACYDGPLETLAQLRAEAVDGARAALAGAPLPERAADPCSQCQPGLVCKKPTCGRLAAASAEQAAQAPVGAVPVTFEPPPTTAVWSRYVAGMIGAYLGWPVDDKRLAAVAGIIDRRRRFAEAPVGAVPLTFEQMDAIAIDGMSVTQLIRAVEAAHGIGAASPPPATGADSESNSGDTP